jgi:hypothetical protein
VKCPRGHKISKTHPLEIEKTDRGLSTLRCGVCKEELIKEPTIELVSEEPLPEGELNGS